MEKIFTFLVAYNEVPKMKGIIDKYSEKIKDYEITKIFKVQSFEVLYFIVVTDDETFNNINNEIEGNRLY